jgi:lycopene beta-cyclase
VVGAGPAGLAVAGDCATRGLDVALVAPDPDVSWRPTYGCWLEEAQRLGIDGCLRHRWTDVVAVGTHLHALGRAYAVLDNDALQARLRRPLGEAAAVVVAGTAEGVVRGADGTATVVGRDRLALRGRVVVDASGHVAVSAQRDPAARRIEQTAFGIVARFTRPPIEPERCVLMDWSAAAPDPTFLYGFDLGGGEQFVEETSLARRPGMSETALRHRLAERLRRLGAEPRQVLAEEVVRFPMDTPVPPPDPFVVPFGAAGGLVHPVTGYSVTASLTLAPRLAEALAGGADGEACHRVLWPPAARRTRRLHRYGMRVVAGMEGDEARALFDAFFDLPRESWTAYLGAGASPADVTRAMAEVFRRAPWRLRRRLTFPLSRRPR